jgi:thioredoxin-related protein
MAPMVNRLFTYIQEDKELSKNIKMMAIGIGDHPNEIAVYRETFKVNFPMLPDPDKEIAGKVKIEVTPGLLFVNKNGKVLISHTGYIENLDALLAEIRKNAQAK